MKQAILDLKQAVDNLRECFEDLPEESFTEPVGEWSPRDLLAHIIGWNRYTITACRQIRMGELPFKLGDSEMDYSIVDAESVQLYITTERDLLLDEIETSYQSLENFLIFMKPEDWDRDFGVRFGEKTITIESVVRALIKNYNYHCNQVKSWSNRMDRG